MSNKIRKKIFIVTQDAVTNVVGGAVNIFFELSNILSDNGYEVVCVCMSDINNLPSRLNSGVRFENLAYKYPENCSFDEGINLILEEEKPDLLVFFFPYLYIKSKLKKEFDNIPRILMFHSRPDFYFQYKKTTRRLKKIYKNTISQISFPSFSALIPEFIRKNGYVVIPNFFNASEFKVDLSDEKKKIVYLSRIDSCKGIEFLIDSFSLIAKKYPDWTIDIYGQAQPHSYINELLDYVSEKQLSNKICFKGLTDNPLETFLKYDFCVFPSFFEGCSLGLLEAQSVGLPSIGLETCTGVNELIVDNLNGLLSPFDCKSFSEKIEKLILSKDLRIKLSANIPKYIEPYQKSIVIKQWLALIDDVINNPNNLKIETACHQLKYKPLSIKYIFSIINSQRKNKFNLLFKKLKKHFSSFNFTL